MFDRFTAINVAIVAVAYLTLQWLGLDWAWLVIPLAVSGGYISGQARGLRATQKEEE